jgi:apolipoprotein N-acyltransferase
VKIPKISNLLPDWKNALLAVLSAVLLILAFPDFELWFLAWFALAPLLFAIEREVERGHSRPHEPEGRTEPSLFATSFRTLSRSCGQECPRSFVLGWIFGVVFFTGTCWWLTYAPINYAGFPPLLAYFLLFCVTAVAAIFPGIFGLLLSVFLRRFGIWAFLLAPFVWVFTEFLRFWITGNNWNTIGYSQAFNPSFLFLAEYGGVVFVGFVVLLLNVNWTLIIVQRGESSRVQLRNSLPAIILIVGLFVYTADDWIPKTKQSLSYLARSQVVAVQANVPMSGLSTSKWEQLRERQVKIAEESIRSIDENIASNPFADSSDPKRIVEPGIRPPTTVIFPESPMNFMYGDDPETKAFINGFAARNNISVLFNSAEPNKVDHKYFNSAVLVGPAGKMIGQYDKIYLLPFGEAVPTPLQSIVPAFVGSFSYGSEYDLLPIGDAKAGVMICFESHFGALSREYVREGADVIIEMTNDGYLGPTPVLRQHLANAVFRAVETNRPVLRVTNVGITAYINERGEVLDAAEPYTEATRVWSVAKSDGSQTFYVKYGDWFAWLCSVVTVAMLFWRRRQKPDR